MGKNHNTDWMRLLQDAQKVRLKAAASDLR